MKTKLSILMMVVLLCANGISHALQQPGPALPVGLLETGEFHGEEVTARTGERWLGLHITNDHSTLIRYRLTVEKVHDPIGDSAGEMTGKKVTVDLPLEPLFLVKGARMLSSGPVNTIFKAAPDFEKSLEKIPPLTLKLAGVSYTLKVVGSKDDVKCRLQEFPRNANLILSSGETEQVLYSLDNCGNDPYWHLLWAGDLDRDGKLDLYVSVNQHYNVSEKRLFLSSQAGEGQLVKEIAEFVTSGC